MPRVVIERFPDDLYRMIKAEAARTDTTARELMIRWLQEKAPTRVVVTYRQEPGQNDANPSEQDGPKGRDH